MITAKLVNVYGHKRESFDLVKAEYISVAPDSKEVRITYSGQERLITMKDGGNLYIIKFDLHRGGNGEIGLISLIFQTSNTLGGHSQKKYGRG